MPCPLTRATQVLRAFAVVETVVTGATIFVAAAKPFIRSLEIRFAEPGQPASAGETRNGRGG